MGDQLFIIIKLYFIKYKMNYKISFYILLGFFILLFLIILSYYILFFISVSYNITNNLYCGKHNCTPPSYILQYKNQNIDFGIFSNYTALYCLDLIHKVYDITKNSSKDFLPKYFSLLNILTYNDNQTIGLILRNDNKIWIVFRGTFSLYDLLRDIKTQQITFREPPFKIHKGVYEIYNQISKDVLDTLKRHYKKDDIIILTGHSLGGALCIPLIYDLSVNNYISYAYTFGSPKVINLELMKKLDKIFKGKLFRVINSEDIAPDCPLSITIHTFNPHNPYFYVHYGHIIIFTDNRMSYFENHSIYTYMDNMPLITDYSFIQLKKS